MMTTKERVAALAAMQSASNAFYVAAIHIGNHPFIEFTGLMNEYIKTCEIAHANGIDFTECNKHAGQNLPMHSFQIDYVNDKLDCIFTGRSVMADAKTENELAILSEARARITALNLTQDNIEASSPDDAKKFLSELASLIAKTDVPSSPAPCASTDATATASVDATPKTDLARKAHVD